jgi:hypothetical protein
MELVTTMNSKIENTTAAWDSGKPGQVTHGRLSAVNENDSTEMGKWRAQNTG